MAQLVKLMDYVSRYEVDLKRYPTQYVRLKKVQWERLRRQWESGQDLSFFGQEEEEEYIEKEPSSKFRIFNWLKKHKAGEDEVYEEVLMENHENEEEIFQFEPNIVFQPNSIEELRRMYIDQLFHFQLKWASSTLLEKSNVEPRFYRDSLLRMLSQQLPDNYFLFYYPVLKIKLAPVELDILIITPTDVFCISVLEEEDSAAFIGSSNHFWIKKSSDTEKKVLSPLISLNRMESIVHQIFQQSDVNMPIHKIVLSRNGYIDYPQSPYGFDLIDKRTFTTWFAKLKKSNVPMKSIQFKATQSILNTVHTTAFHRLK